MTRAAARLLDFWFAPVPAVRLDAFRRALALAFLVYMTVWFSQEPFEWLTADGFHYTSETRPFGTPLPAPLLPRAAVPLFATLLFASTVALVLGLRPRLAIWPVVGCALYVRMVDDLASFTLNILFVTGFAIVALAPAPTADRRQSAWPVRMLQATLLVQYFTAGTCKIMHGDWMSHGDALWTQAQGVFRTDTAAWMLRTLPLEAWTGMQYAALVFELLAPLLFTVRRLRPVAYVWGLGFHLLIAATMQMLILFSLQMLAFYVLFLDERRLSWLSRLRRRGRGVEAPT